MKKLLLMCVLLLPLLVQSKQLTVTYLWHTTKEQPFTKKVNEVLLAVAKDLDINLNIVFPNGNASSYGNLNRYSYEKFAKEYFFQKEKPDVIISMLFRKAGKHILDFSHASRVPLFIVNTNIPVEDKKTIKKPREVYPYFLGVLASDEKQAGKLLIDSLVSQVKAKKPIQNIEVIGIGGPKEASEAVERNMGLSLGLKNVHDVHLYQVVDANWDEELAYKKTSKLLKRYPSLDIIWAGSDSMALGAKRAVMKDNRDILVGGIDWTDIGANSVKNGLLDVSVGGHFLNGGIALILLYDYFHGVDFKDDLGVEINLDMFALTSKNIDYYKKYFTAENLDSIDFSRYSKVLNPMLKKYDFSLKSFMDALNKK